MSVFEPQPPEFYSQEQIQEILQLAIARQANQGELSRTQLWEIAEELKIDSEALQAAEKDWLNHLSLQQKRQAFDAYRQNKLKQNAVKYLIVNGFLVSINLIATGAISWSLYVLLLWGMGLSLEVWKTSQSQGEAYEQAFRRWTFKQEMQGFLASTWSKVKKTWQI